MHFTPRQVIVDQPGRTLIRRGCAVAAGNPGLVRPRRSLRVTARQFEYIIGAGVATLVTLGALTGVHAARSGSRRPRTRPVS